MYTRPKTFCRERNGKPKPRAKWLSVMRAKARKPQKTRAWAKPATGRCLITLAWRRTSQMKSATRRGRWLRTRPESGLAAAMISTTLRKRARKTPAEATMSATRSSFSGGLRTMQAQSNIRQVPESVSRAMKVFAVACGGRYYHALWRQVTNNYYFITRWRVKASAEDVFAIISEPLEYPRWWPAVYLSAESLGEGRVRFHTRGWLP